MGIKFTNFKNLVAGELRHRMIFAFVLWGTASVSMLKFVIGIVTTRPPVKIIKEAMGRDTVFMTALLTRGAWPYESEQNEAVNPNGRVSFIIRQGNRGITKAQGWFKGSLRRGRYTPLRLYSFRPLCSRMATTFLFPIGSNPSLIANFVTGEARNWLENLRGIGKLGITHCADLLSGWCVGESRAGVHAPRLGSFFITYKLSFGQ